MAAMQIVVESGQKSSLVTVYGLFSSEDRKVRYIGQTTKPLRTRFGQHLNSAKKGWETQRRNKASQELGDA